jgi:hypothetical protein
MSKALETLLERVAHWPQDAREDAVATLEAIEARVIEESRLSAAAREARLAGLREMIRSSIERGSGYTPEDIDAMIEERFGESRVRGR